MKTKFAITVSLAVVTATTPILQAFAQEHSQASPTLTRAVYEKCQTQDEAAFRNAIEAITIEAFTKATAHLDYDALVRNAWHKTDFDTVIDEEVDKAVEDVRQESSWGNLIRSLMDQKRAQALATAVAERVYRSDRVKQTIEQLALIVGKDLGQQVELAASDASKPALTCLRAFLGPRYGSMITQAVTQQADRDFAIRAEENQADISSGTILQQSTGGLTGAAILLVRRQLANMARRIGARLVGSVLSRIVSVVAGGVGLVLIAKDLWDLRHGVLPIIAEEMKADSTKEKVREELARSIQQEMQSQVRDIARDTAGRIVAVWRDFKSAHNAALALADRNADFKTFLNNVRPEKLAQLDEIILLLRQTEGDGGIEARLGNGSLEQAVLRLPGEGMTIARETRKLDEAIAWHALAGDADLPAVVTNGLHRTTTPETLTKADLKQILSIGDRISINRLAGLSPQTRPIILALDTANLKTLSSRLTHEELTILAAYLRGLEKTPRQQVLEAVAAMPQKMLVLGSERVRRAIVGSRDQLAAVQMMLRTDQGFNPTTAFQDIQLAVDGQVSPVLLWDKHPGALLFALFLAFMFVLILRRIFMPRQRPTSSEDNKNNIPSEA